MYKKKIRIVNAVVPKHTGNPSGLQETCNQLNQYMLEKQMVPITVGYTITRKMDMWELKKY